MHKPSILAACAAVLVLLLSACDGMSRGIIITGNGKVGSDNARNQRENAQDALKIAIEDDLGQGSSANVAIDELPVWVDDVLGADGAWKWQHLTARVVIAPPVGGTLSPAKLDEYTTGARTYLLAKIVKKDPQQLALTVSAAPVGAKAVAAPVAVAPAADGPRSYVVQEGDTLALISTVFYGSPQQWRRILDANPGLTADAVKPGVRLLVP